MQSTDYVYVLGDGDKIREKVEYYLFKHDLATLKSFSQNLTTAINKIREFATSTMDAQIIMAGGDDIFFYISSEKYKIESIQTLREIFYNITGIPISFGVGKTIETAYINVRKAKTSKDIKIVEEEEQ